MGVTGLWKLIEQSGKEVAIETLENKVLAVDISIWLHQVIKGFQDRKGNALQNAHLLGLFNRLCKLLFYKIKPVFIFDGSVPLLKRETIAKRQQGRTKILKEVERIQELLLEAMNKEKIVRHALDPNSLKETSPNKCNVKEKKNDDEGIFTIPEYLSPVKVTDDTYQPNSSSDFNTSLSENDSFDDSSLQHYYNINLQSIDVTSSHFKSLPADVRLEILGDIREMRKQHSWGRLHEMPTESNNFSNFQMKRLLKRRQVQVSLEEAEKELEGRCLTLSELETFLSEQGIVQAEKSAKSRINSDANTRFLLVKDLKKAIEKAAKMELLKNESVEEELKVKKVNNLKENDNLKENPKEEAKFDEVGVSSISKETDHENYNIETDLELAIQLSLNQTNTYNDNDYLAQKACLNKEQKNMFKNATGSARDYLLKYGLIKNLDLDEMEESQIEATENSEILNNLKHNKSLVSEIIGVKDSKENLCITKNKVNMGIKSQIREEENQVDERIAIVSDSDSDVDFVEVNDSTNIMQALEKNEKIQIHLDPTKEIKPQDDMFADIFLNGVVKNQLNSKLYLNEKTDESIKKLSNEITSTQNQKQNMTDILQSLQKEALDITKLSLDNINTENSLIEVPDSQESNVSNKINSLTSKNIIFEDNQQTSVQLSPNSMNSIEDSKKSCSVAKNCFVDKSYNAENSETEKINSIKVSDSVIEILDSQENECESGNQIEISESYTEDMKTVCNLRQITECKVAGSSCIEIRDSQNDELIFKGDTKTISNSCQITECEFAGPSCIEIQDSQNDELITKGDKEREFQKIEICDLQNSNIKTNDSVKIFETNCEVIEILDDSIEPLEKSPTKQKIEDFFKAEYVIKKTPSKKENEKMAETPTKVTPPSLVQKTSVSSSSKKSLLENKSEKRVSKASKALFEREDKNDENPMEKDIEMKLIEKESELLRSHKSKEDLESMALKLDKEKFELEKERNRQDRLGLTVTERMKRDCMDLLKLFGIPYLVAPMEAEAQCAFLEAAELTNGTITDDSDIWLFGGRTVYKNFFDKQKHVLEFKNEQIQRDFSLDRDKLIQLAFLVGSDYTIGIKGIGAVTALEILAAFPHTPVVKNETTKVMSILSSLRKFRDWFSNSKSGVGDSIKVKLKTQLKNVEISTGFPNLAVAEAYLHPHIDDSKDPFTWGVPDLEEIKKFARKYFGWAPIKTEDTLRPVLKRLEQKKSQTTIKNFFNVKHSAYKKDIKLSKRVEKAVKKMSINYDSEEDNLVNLKTKLNKKQNSKKVTSLDVDNKVNSKRVLNRKRKTKIDKEGLVRLNGTSAATQVFGESPEKKIKTTETDEVKKPCIPQTRQVIPQKERDVNEMNKRKEVASALFKRTRAAANKSKKN